MTTTTEKTYSKKYVDQLLKQIENLKAKIEDMENNQNTADSLITSELLELLQQTANDSNQSIEKVIQKSITSYCTRKQKYIDKKSDEISLSEQKFIDTVESIKRFNALQSEQSRRYFITPTLVLSICSMSGQQSKEYYLKYQDDIDSYNQLNGLTQSDNRKKMSKDILKSFYLDCKKRLDDSELIKYSSAIELTDL